MFLQWIIYNEPCSQPCQPCCLCTAASQTLKTSIKHRRRAIMLVSRSQDSLSTHDFRPYITTVSSQDHYYSVSIAASPLQRPRRHHHSIYKQSSAMSSAPIWVYAITCAGSLFILLPAAIFLYRGIKRAMNKPFTPVGQVVQQHSAARRLEEGVWRPTDSLEDLGPDTARPTTPPPVYIRQSSQTVQLDPLTGSNVGPSEQVARDPSPDYQART